jgi:hypothetical protein
MIPKWAIPLGTKAAALQRRTKTHCKYGHAFDEKNTRITKEGHRCCRTCKIIYQKENREWERNFYATL